MLQKFDCALNLDAWFCSSASFFFLITLVLAWFQAIKSIEIEPETMRAMCKCFRARWTTRAAVLKKVEPRPAPKNKIQDGMGWRNLVPSAICVSRPSGSLMRRWHWEWGWGWRGMSVFWRTHRMLASNLYYIFQEIFPNRFTRPQFVQQYPLYKKGTTAVLQIGKAKFCREIRTFWGASWYKRRASWQIAALPLVISSPGDTPPHKLEDWGRESWKLTNHQPQSKTTLILEQNWDLLTISTCIAETNMCFYNLNINIFKLFQKPGDRENAQKNGRLLGKNRRVGMSENVIY